MKKKILVANLQRIIELFTLNIVIKLSKYRFGIRVPDLGYGKTYSGSGIRIRNTGFFDILL